MGLQLDHRRSARLLVEAGQGVKEGAKVNEQLKSEWIWFGGMLLAMALISWVTLGFPL
jgi:hypothetical protein